MPSVAKRLACTQQDGLAWQTASVVALLEHDEGADSSRRVTERLIRLNPRRRQPKS